MQAAKLIIKTVRSGKNVLRINLSKVLMARYQKKRSMSQNSFHKSAITSRACLHGPFEGPSSSPQLRWWTLIYGIRPMQIISNIALISINETFIVQIISFLIFLYIINRIMFQPLRSIMADRENHIKSIQQDIVTADHKLDALADQIRAQESAVRSEAFAQKALLEKAGGRRADEIFADTRKEIEAARAKAQIEVDAQLLEAKKHIEEQSEILMLSVMEKVLNRRLNP